MLRGSATGLSFLSRSDGTPRMVSMVFNSPISSEKADRLVQLLELPLGGRALDAGCGIGEFLLRVVAHHRVNGVGVDQDLRCIAAAQANAAVRGLVSRCEFRAADVNAIEAGLGAFDLGICIGATHAFGAGDAAYPNAIERLKCLVQPDGYVLIGESYWKQEPAAEYLALIGEPVGVCRGHAGNISFAEERGLVPLYAAVSSDDEWDDFEWRHYMKIRCDAEANSGDPALAAKLTRVRHWRDGYLRWGRSTMGFGLYLFRVPRE
jgi:SAM-dependent methyltransferase